MSTEAEAVELANHELYAAVESADESMIVA